MKLTNKVTKIKQAVVPVRDLKTTLSLLLLQIESIKGDLDLDKIFNTIGNELQKIKISTVISIIDEKKENVVFRYLKLKDSYQESYLETKIKKIEITKLKKHQLVFNEKGAIFCQNRISQLKKSLPSLKLLLDKIKESNSIISPLILKGEVVGILEIFSKNITEKDVDLVKNFTQDLALSIANTILFQEIKKSEERYRELWDNAPVAYHILDTKGIIRKVNKTEAKMLGYPPELMVGKSIFEFILPEQRAEARERFRLKIADQKVPKKDNRIYIKQDGSKIYVSIDDILEYDNNGKIIGVRTTMVDITEQKKIEKALKNSEKKYKNFVEKSLEGVWQIDKKGITTFASRRMGDILGYTPQEMMGKNFMNLMDKEAKKEAITLFSRRKMGVSEIHNFRFKHKTGRDVFTTLSTAPITEKGEFKGAAAYVTDITDQKEAEVALRENEKKLSQIVQGSTIPTFVINNKHKILYWNKACEKLTSYPKHEMIGTNKQWMAFYSNNRPVMADLIVANQPEKIIAKYYGHTYRRSALIDGAYEAEDFFPHLGRNGKWLFFTATPLRDISGKLIGAIETLQDMTERKQSEEEIKYGFEVRSCINKLLQISLKEMSLEKMLEEIIYCLTSIDWIALKAKGGIWLTSDKSDTLVLKAQCGLSKKLQKQCVNIPFGTCLCGLTAKSGKVEFASQIDERHERRLIDMAPHGHYCVPIISKNKVLGIINFYLKSGHQYNKKEVDFLRSVSNVLASIIERQQAEEALRESEEKYRKLVDNAHDGVFIINAKGYITFANKAFYKISGYHKKNLANLHFSKLVHPDDYNTIAKRFIDRLAGKKLSPTFEFRGIDQAGKTKYISISGTPIVEGKKVIGLQEIIRDITEKKKLQKKVEQAKEHYEQVINTIGDGICVIDRNFKIVSCNKEFAKQINLPIAKIKGQNCMGIIPRYKNDFFKNNCSHLICDKDCLADTVFKEGKSLSFIEKGKDSLGKIFYHRISIFPAKNKGEVYQIVLVIEDVTERKMAEEEIRRLHEFNKRILDNAPVSIIVLDKEGTITSTNEYIKILSKSTDLVGKNIFTISFFQRENLVNQYKKLLRTGKSFAKSNCQTTNQEGQIKYLNIIAIPLKNKKGNIDGAISMALDNTETVLAKQKLEDLNRNLEKKVIKRTQQLDKINKQLNKVLELKSKFISDASHELRTPLTVIQGNLDLATRETKNLNNETPETFNLINKEIEQMSGILADLTMLTNSDSQTEKLAYEKVDLAPLIKAVSQSLGILARPMKIKIKSRQRPKQLTIMGDEAKVEKLLLNIVRNAIKYNNENGWVKIWTEKDNSGVNIYVEDNGIGIPGQDLPYIFERFYRVDKARSQGESGTGLGLSIAKWIAEAHQGKISAESALGKGSKFTIHLPYDYKKQREKISLFG